MLSVVNAERLGYTWPLGATLTLGRGIVPTAGKPPDQVVELTSDANLDAVDEYRLFATQQAIQLGFASGTGPTGRQFGPKNVGNFNG